MGFMPIKNYQEKIQFDGQKLVKGQALLEAQHVEIVLENRYKDRPTEIVGYCVRQTTIREEFIVRIYRILVIF